MRFDRRIAAAILALLAPALGTAGEMKDELKLDAAHPNVLRTSFATYGYQPQRSVVFEKGGYRFWLPAGVAGVGQTGVYSYFSLSGDCEVTLGFELLNLPSPREGYGSGLGLAFDAGDDIGRATLQRVEKLKNESGYILQISPGKKSPLKEEYLLVPSAATRGRMGLRREKKELVFLASDDLKAPLVQIGSLAFTDQTIRAVRFFADPGGSPTAVDARVGEIEIRAEQITGGVPRSESGHPLLWLWTLVPVAGAGLAFWGWRRQRRRASE